MQQPMQILIHNPSTVCRIVRWLVGLAPSPIPPTVTSLCCHHCICSPAGLLCAQCCEVVLLTGRLLLLLGGADSGKHGNTLNLLSALRTQ
jgi:hypothetical protein